MIVLLSVIFLSFIGLGLPDTVIGSIWPVIQKETSSSVYGAGIITLYYPAFLLPVWFKNFQHV